MFATIYIPDFFLQASLRHEQIAFTTPVALIDENENKPVIIQCNAAAEQARVCLGMAPSQGLARCLNLVIKTRSLAKEQALANLLLQYCFSLSPSVEQPLLDCGRFTSLELILWTANFPMLFTS